MNDTEIKKQNEYIKKIEEMNQKGKYCIITMGCQLNENDSEKIAGMLEKMGYSKTENMEEASIILFNTCCVRENAEEKLFGKLGEVKKHKEQRDTIIAIGGCMMQEEHIVRKIRKSYPQVDIIFGTHTLHKLPEHIYKIIKEKSKIDDILDIDGEIYEGIPIKRNDNKKALVTIMYGCNNFCSYCIVPYVRGRERSRRPQDIITEIQELAKQGYKEITLLGQNVNSYMKDKKENKDEIQNFAQLLKKIEEIEGIEIIKFMSPHPKDFSDELIEVIAHSTKITRLIHLPLQAGSSNVLKKMNRKYTKEQYLALVRKMKERISGLALSTDIIVGFPGETEEDFEQTLDVVKQVQFEQVYMFIYSKRIGTPGAKMENQVPDEVKHKRFNILKNLVEKQIEEQNLAYIHTTQKVLIEGYSKNNPLLLTGRTNTNKIVVVEGAQELIGTIANVTILSQHMWYLKGKIEEKRS